MKPHASDSKNLSDNIDKKKLSDDHLCEGDIFSIFGLNGESSFRIAKVVKAKEDAVHLFVYHAVFAERPRWQALKSQLLVPDDVRQARDMSVPVSRKLFSLMRPIFLANEAVLDAELSGYRCWVITGGEILGDQFRLEDEIESNWKVYAKIFLSSALPFSIIFALFCWLRYEAWYGLPEAFLLGTTFGIVMVVLQWSSIRRESKRSIPWRDSRRNPLKTGATSSRLSHSSVQFAELELKESFAKSFEKGIGALATIKNCKPTIIDAKGGTIEAHVQASLMEERQELLIVFSRLSADRSGVIVWSESSGGSAVDMGKNLANINAIISHLKSSRPENQQFGTEVEDNKPGS